MFAILSIAAALLVALTAAVGLYGLVRHRARAGEARNDLIRAGQHPLPGPYEPGAGYATTAGVTGGGGV
jgi:hypothetical protein